MNSQGVAGASPAGGPAVTTQTASPHPPAPPSQHKAVKLLLDLDDLLLLNGAEPFRGLWEELKTHVAQLTVAAQAAENNQIKKLTEAVTALIEKQKQPTAPALSYAAALRTGLNTSPPARQVPTRLSRELVVTNPNATPQDRNRPISQ